MATGQDCFLLPISPLSSIVLGKSIAACSLVPQIRHFDPKAFAPKSGEARTFATACNLTHQSPQHRSLESPPLWPLTPLVLYPKSAHLSLFHELKYVHYVYLPNTCSSLTLIVRVHGKSWFLQYLAAFLLQRKLIISFFLVWALPEMPSDVVLGRVRWCYQKTLGGGPPPVTILLLLPTFKQMKIFLFSLNSYDFWPVLKGQCHEIFDFWFFS